MVAIRLAVDHRPELGERRRDDRQLLVVANTIASSVSVRTVATCVPGAMRTTSGCGAVSQNVTVGARRGRREERDADQLEELDVVAVRDAVEPVDQLVGHPGEQLDERHAGVGDVVVGPLGAALLDEPLGVVDEVLEPAVVEVGDGQRHQRLIGGSGLAGIT